MKTYTIESRVTRIETIEIKAESRQEAIEAAEQAENRFWTTISEDERQLTSIS